MLCYHFVFPLLYQGGRVETAPQFECGHGLCNCNNKKPSNGISSIKRSISNNTEGTQPYGVRQIYSSWQLSTRVACLDISISCMSVARTDRIMVCLPWKFTVCVCMCVRTPLLPSGLLKTFTDFFLRFTFIDKCLFLFTS